MILRAQRAQLGRVAHGAVVMLSGTLMSSEDFLGLISGGQRLGAQLTMSPETPTHGLPLWHRPPHILVAGFQKQVSQQTKAEVSALLMIQSQILNKYFIGELIICSLKKNFAACL